MSNHKVRWLGAAVAVGLLAAACGSAREDSGESTAAAPAEEATAEPAEDTAPDDDGDGDEEPAATEDAGAADAGDDATDEAAAAEPTEEPTPDVPMFGDEPWPCGPGDASGATQQGITDETIKIGVGDDRGFPNSPGLNKEMTDSVNAVVAICNEMGGINGRMIETVLYDAAIFNAGQVILEACDQVFMLVGFGWSLDTGSEPDRVACGMGSVPGFTVSADAAHGPFMHQGVPNPADQANFGHGWIIENVIASEQGLDVTNSAAMFANYAATEETWEKIELSWPPNTNFEFPTEVIYNVTGEDDWTPFALQLKSSEADVVYYTGSCFPNYQGIRQAADVNEFDAIWTMETNFYEAGCRDANTDGAMDNSYIRMGYVPFEEAEFNAATADFLEIVEAAGVEPAVLGAQAVSSFLLWARAASSCGSDLTSDCVLEYISAVDEWTGHGLHIMTNPATNEAPECLAIVVLEGTEYKRVYPSEPATFACPADEGFDEWVVPVETVASEAALLDENRVSTKYTGG